MENKKPQIKRISRRPKKAPPAPDGSTMAPGVGNTTSKEATPGELTKPRGNCKKGWLITLKASGGSNGSIKSWIIENCDSAVWQMEKGSDTGYEHYQITMELKTKQRLSWIKNHMDRTCHAESINNHDAAFDYSQKEDTRILGPWFHPQPIQRIKDPMEGKTPYPWQQEILELIETEPDERTVHWYWEPNGNQGKSALAKHLVLKYDALVVSGKKNDIYHAIDNQCKILILDIPRTVEDHVPYEAIECIKNGMIFSGKYESKMKTFNPPHIICFANFEPNQQKLSKDRWSIKNVGSYEPTKPSGGTSPVRHQRPSSG